MKLPRPICIVCGKGGPHLKGLARGVERPWLAMVPGESFYVHPRCVVQRLIDTGAKR